MSCVLPHLAHGLHLCLCARAQVKAGSIFDNILVADSFAEAETFAQATWGKNKDAEKAAFDKIKEEEKVVKEAADAAAAKDKPETGDDDSESAAADVDDDYDEDKPSAEKPEKDEL